MIDPREKEGLFQEAIAMSSQWLSVIARNNAPADSWQDLEQEMRIAFWKNLDSYDGQNSNLEKWLYSVAKKTVKVFKRTNRSGWERDARLYESPVFVEQDRGQWRILEEFMGILSDVDRQVFAMYLDDTRYREMSAMLGVNEPALRKRLSRIKEQFKAKYMGY